MKYLRFIFFGLLFGIVMVKAQIVSWYRIVEMFHFDAFHMYGVIGSAVVLGVISVSIIKHRKLKDMYGEVIHMPDKNHSWSRYLIGGFIFGLGWALIGACPGPMFVLFGGGYFSILIVMLGALVGTFIYGMLRDHLPH